MALTLIVNPGSSSKKFALIKDGRTVLSMRFERNGQVVELCTQHHNEQKKCEAIDSTLYSSALEHVLTTAGTSGYVAQESDITHVGIRVVAPGTYFQRHRVIDAEYLAQLTARTATAPLHIPTTLSEINLIQTLLPESLLVGVSDSAFHSGMPTVARTYSIKREDTTAYDIYRYGYHGLSCASVVRKLELVLGSRPQRVVIAHVGSGVSVTALRDGQSIDTSMGFSPVSGMVMGTRAGDIESGALLELMRARNMNLTETQQYLQTAAGLKGLARESDFRHLLERMARGETEATEALALFAYRFKKLLGSYVAALNGLDALIFTATAAERSPIIRALMTSDLDCFGIHLDAEKNEQLMNHDGVISVTDSPVAIALIRNQELDEMVRVTNNFSVAG